MNRGCSFLSVANLWCWIKSLTHLSINVKKSHLGDPFTIATRSLFYLAAFPILRLERWWNFVDIFIFQQLRPHLHQVHLCLSCDVRTYVFKSPFVGLFECEKVAETFVFRRNLWLTNDDKAWMVAVNPSTKAVARGYSGTLFQRGGLITCIVQPYLLVVAISHCR